MFAWSGQTDERGAACHHAEHRDGVQCGYRAKCNCTSGPWEGPDPKAVGSIEAYDAGQQEVFDGKLKHVLSYRPLVNQFGERIK